MKYAVGVDLGGTSIKAALVEHGVGLVHQTAVPTDAEKGPEAVLDRIEEVVRAMEAVCPDGCAAGVGIGVPGSVNWERTTLIRPANLPGWGVIDVRATLQHRLGRDLPVVVENDASAAALGSAHYGVGKPFDSFIMITLGTGVGGAIIYKNTIFRGTSGAAGEIGHMSIDYDGPASRQGVPGAVEAYIGQRFLSHHARYRLLGRPHSRIHEIGGPDLEDLTPKLLHTAAVEGDENAQGMLAWAGHKLGAVLGSVINLLDIRKVVVGGGVSAADDMILDPAREAIRVYTMPTVREGVEIVRETRGNEVGMLGAAHLVFELLDDSA
ncbi:MAG: ROK family protein [Bacteroidota bacterium]